MARFRAGAAGLLTLAVLASASLVLLQPRSEVRTPADGRQLAPVGAGQPLAFEPNAGRFDGSFDYLQRGHGSTLAIGPTQTTLRVGSRAAELRTRIVGAAGSARAVPGTQLAGKVNWYVGGDRSRWRTGLPTFAGVRYAQVYPGIDVRYGGRQGRLEYDFLVAPHARAGRITLDLAGARGLRIDGNGDLVARLGDATVRQLRPVAYQGTTRVPVSFALEGTRVSFRLGAYDQTRPLVIDPVLAYSDYFGGTGSDGAYDVASDSGHNAIIAGYTSSSSIPGVSGGSSGSAVGMVAKIAPDGTRLWATFLGTSVKGVAVDGTDNIVLAGTTDNTLATTPGAAQTTFGGATVDAFAARLGPDGVRSWVTYLGGTGFDTGAGVAADQSGAVYVVGETSSTSGIATGGTFQATNQGLYDGFLVKYSPSGARSYGTYLGGSTNEGARAVGVAPGCQSSCPAFVGGYSPDAGAGGTNFPTTGGTDHPVHDPNQGDGFIIRINATGGRDWSTYTPHSQASGSSVYGLAVSPAGNPTVVGTQGQANSTGQAYVATFLAGSGTRGPDPDYYSFNTTGDGFFHDIAYDAQGNAYVIGETGSTNLATIQPVQASQGGVVDAFAMKFAAGRSAGFPIWTTYLGGSQIDYGYGIAPNGNGGVYLAGYTYSSDFPSVDGKQGASTAPDAFIARIDVKIPKIDSGPTGTIRSKSATFTYSGGEGAFQCHLTGEADFSSCPSVGKTYSGLADGDYTFDVRSVDAAGSPSAAVSQKFAVDTKPVAAFTIAPNPALVGRTVTFDASTSLGDDGAIARYEWDLDGDGSFETDGGANKTTAAEYSAPRASTVGLRITTAAGAQATATQELHVTDAVGALQFGVTINNGAQYTRTPNVTVTASFPTTTRNLLFANDGGFLAAATLPAQKDTKWKLDSSGPERLPKIVYVRFVNGPLVSETHIDDIILDEIPPKVEQAVVAPAAAASSARFARASRRAKLRSWKVKVRAKDSNSGVSKLQVTSNKKKPGKVLKYKTRLKVKSRARPRWIRARDKAGNWSKWKKAR
ncbi:MAG: hypothetical protein QOJ29_4705 [Thermoleophilaceae bacterium]|jgi:hypothetical protein|nr:hypothetical protein [Thermoleophilaceae bacterium]